MRVAVVTESFLPTVSGVTTSVRHVLDYLAAHGHDAMLIAPSGHGPTTYAGFPVHRMPAILYRQFPVGIPGPQLADLLADFAPDVVHVASPFLLGAQAISSAQRLGVPSVAIFQTDIARYAARNGFGAAGASVAWKFVKRIHAAATLTLVPSSASRSDLETAGIKRLDVWARGVDITRYHPNNRLRPETMELRERIAGRGAGTAGRDDRDDRDRRDDRHSPDDRDRRDDRHCPDDRDSHGVGTAGRRDVIVGYVGRLAAEKELATLAALRGEERMRLVLIGDGPDRRMLGRRLAALDPVFLGALHGDELATAYAALDIFVHPGTTETFGQTLQEAHATGLPVVAAAAGGPLDLVRPGVDGFLFEPRDGRSLRQAVRTLIDDPGMRARFGEAGRRAVLDNTWEQVCSDLLGHYAEAIASHAMWASAAASAAAGSTTAAGSPKAGSPKAAHSSKKAAKQGF